MQSTKRIGIVAHSAEGGALCFLSACRDGQYVLGPHLHPEIVVSAIPMGLSMPGWESGDHAIVAKWLSKGVEQVAAAGAEFYVCPDNTAHIVLEQIADSLPIPGLHIADVVALEMKEQGWWVAGLLGTKWTMNGSVYPRALNKQGLRVNCPDEGHQELIDRAIFNELCRGVFLPATIERFVEAIRGLKSSGADCVILGCTEIPLIIDQHNAPLPVLDSTRLLARYAVSEALSGRALAPGGGWIVLEESASSAVPFSRG
jgi:aspartate racemase